MSLVRQPTILTDYDPKSGVSVTTLAFEYPSRFQVPEHGHDADQVIYAVRGLMEVSSGPSTWLIPPHFALWMPARIVHRIHMPGPVSMRTLYLRAGLAQRTERRAAVLHVTPLLRELISETVRLGQLKLRNRYHCALRDLLVAQLEHASPIPTFVTLPQEPRALAIAHAILRKPDESNSMAGLCSQVGIGVRTFQRTFAKEVGMDFDSWRRQARLKRAIELLLSGCSVKETAAKVGYSQPSAFVETFFRTFGKTPKAWVSALELQARSKTSGGLSRRAITGREESD
jgi:AraC-like DNA-binding protein